ncbi:glycoside hydrolase family 13 protein [Solilutibacter silvestris]|uniref:Alpha amylase, catalytic domain n=1 Tax=Solilutibacter silvestris TaxID=1645665 RepID=A0A2K1Q1M9_9GAMM|nr:glycoside hydrolase family 13 protein [Lysobacter silvestris]PNS08941.1 Alpha amylase, catalytic domain [Lysobacter silvestris]
MRLATLLCCFLFAIAIPAGATTIDHLEPASWWVGMKHHRVELMVHGDGIAATTPRLQRAGVTIVDVQQATNPNYLFVTVDVAGNAKPGAFDIEFVEHGKVVAKHPWRLDARAPGSAQRHGFDDRDAIYLITPDRFANADPRNDSVAGMKEAANRSDAFGRHGGDLAGIRQHLDYIAGLGFTQAWITPVLENDQPKQSYHGYAITDLYHVDPRFGSNGDYRALSQEARARGVGLIMDVVLNHIGSGHWWMRDLPSSDWINNGGKFFHTNHRRTTIQDPHAAAADRRTFVEGWFGPDMPDLNQRNPHLARYLIQNTLWWIEYAGLSGIREDTFGYADTQFVSDWGKAVMDEYPHFAMVGEEWSTNPAIVAHWQRGKVNPDGHVPYMTSMMDFPIHTALRSALLQPETQWESGWVPLYETLSNDFLYPDPDRLVIFAENHDTTRLLAQVDGDIGLWKIAMAYIATMRGVPQFYYGSEVLLRGPKERNDGQLRADMPGGWAGDAANAFTGAGLSSAQRDAQDYVRKLFQWRKRTPVVQTGKLTHFAPEGPVYVYVRHDGAHAVMVALNKGDTGKVIALDRFADFVKVGDHARDVLGEKDVQLGATLSLPAKSETILELR